MAFGEQFGELDGDEGGGERASMLGDSGLKFSLTDKMRMRHSATDPSGFTEPAESRSKSQADQDAEDAEEEADQVAEMPGADIFDNSQTRSQRGASKRFASVSTGDEFYQGQARARLGLDK